MCNRVSHPLVGCCPAVLQSSITVYLESGSFLQTLLQEAVPPNSPYCPTRFPDTQLTSHTLFIFSCFTRSKSLPLIHHVQKTQCSLCPPSDHPLLLVRHSFPGQLYLPTSLLLICVTLFTMFGSVLKCPAYSLFLPP